MSAAQETGELSGLQLREKVQTSEDELYRNTLLFIVKTASDLDVDIRFVGGTITDLIGEETILAVDEQEHTIFLEGNNPLHLRRNDGTVKDIDLLSMCPDKDHVDEFKRRIKNREMDLKKLGFTVPQISLNATYYQNAPDAVNPWPERKKWAQAVSSIDHDGTGYSLNFGSIHVPVSDRSLERWNVELDDGTVLPMFHPYIHVLRYYMRFAGGLKSKDRAKVAHLFNFSTTVIKSYVGSNGKDAYAEYYPEWYQFIDQMCLNQYPGVSIKRDLSHLYWNTIGSEVAHGKGILGKLLLPLSDKGTG